MDDPKITHVVLSIGGERKELTLEEARKLRDDLNVLFGPTVTVAPYQPTFPGTTPWQYDPGTFRLTSEPSPIIDNTPKVYCRN